MVLGQSSPVIITIKVRNEDQKLWKFNKSFKLPPILIIANSRLNKILNIYIKIKTRIPTLVKEGIVFINELKIK